MAHRNFFISPLILRQFGRLSALLDFTRAALLSLVMVLCCHAAADPLRAPDLADKPTLKVAMDDNYPPYIFRDANGNLTGYLVDVWNLWQDKTNVRVEIVATDWKVATENMAAGRVDVIDTIFQTPEREKTLTFMPAYAEIPVSIYAHLGVGGITDLNTLKGFLVGVKAADTCIKMLQEAGINTLEIYPNYEALVRGAQTGGAKVFCLDEPPADYLLYRDGADNQVRKAFLLYTGAFHRAVHRGDEKTYDLLLRGFGAISPAELNVLHDKWMGAPLAFVPYRRYLLYAVLVIVSILALAFLGGVALRRVINQRTEQLNAERSMLNTLINTIPDLIWLKDKNGIYLSCNSRFEEFFGRKEADIVGKTDYDFVDAELADSFRRHDKMAMEEGTPRTNEEWITFASDHVRRLFETVKTPMFDAKGGLVGVLGIGRDITAHHQALQKLQASENFFQTLAVVNPVGIFRTDANRKFIFVNQRWSDITRISAEEALGQNWNIGIYRDDFMLAESEWNTALLYKRAFSLEFRIQQPGGIILWVMGQAVATKDEHDHIDGFVGTITDINRRKTSEDEIKYLAFYDSLTNLPNRRLLYERLQQAIRSANRVHSMGAVIFIDLDDFKSINDTSGHEIGDMLLQQVAPILSSCVREVDTVARLGGDEFVIVLEGLTGEVDEAAAQVKAVARKVLDAINRNYVVGDVEHHTTGSIGITLFGHQPVVVDELLKQADLAMYQSKLAGRNTLRFFDEEMQAVASKRAMLESDIRKGIQEHQFLLHYQPQFHSDGNMIGVESLVRWAHPQRGLVYPADFIALTEESGMILPLGAWVLRQACIQLVAWKKLHYAEHLTMAVNVSSYQFKQHDFVQMVLRTIEETGANPNRLKLELTESLLLDNVEEVISKMATLKSHGIGFALDDFGTGYSSLSYLKRLPLDQLKIDRSFIRDVLDDPDDAIIAKTIISLGKSLGLSVIAEGVETEAQRAFLEAQDCHAYQGYLFSKPLPPADFEQLLNQSNGD